LQRAFELIVDNGAGVVIYLRDGRDRRHSLQCTPARQRLDDIETQILDDLNVDPGATALFPTLPSCRRAVRPMSVVRATKSSATTRFPSCCPHSPTLRTASGPYFIEFSHQADNAPERYNYDNPR
jgi:hypothetical protein